MYALGALAAVLFGYDNGIIGAALLFIPRDLPLTPWQEGAVVSATVFGAMVGALAKEGVDELKVLREYLETVAKGRSGPWKTFYQAARQSTGV